MAMFKVTWDDGSTEVLQKSDCHSVEQFINSRFGAGVKPTAKVELLEPKAEVVQEPAVEAKPKAKAAPKA